MQKSPHSLLDEQHWQHKGGLLSLQGILGQPDIWREGLKIVRRHEPDIRDFWHRLGDQPLNILLCGAGSSLNAARAVAPWLRQQTGHNIRVLASTDIVVKPALYLENRPTLLVSVSSSGSTPESLAVYELAERLIDECYHLIVVNDPDGALPDRARHNANSLYIPAPAGTKNGSFAATAEFTLPLWYLLLIFLPEQWALAERALTVYRHGAQSFFSHQADRVMQLAEADAPLVVSLGSASLQYIAADASLKLLEMCNGLQATDDHSSLSFRHGPKLIVNQPVTVIVYLSPDEEILRYDLDMAAELKAQRHPLGKVVGIYAAEDPRAAVACDELLHFSAPGLRELPEVFSGMLYILFAQLLGLLRAGALGVTPDSPSQEGKVAKVCRVTLY